VINCTGLLASKLGGVEDKSVVPARGQTVLVRNDPGFMGCVSGTDDGVGGDDELIYFMKRAAGMPSPSKFTNPILILFPPRWRYHSRRLLPTR
jgi:hypothetical protein